MEPPNPKVDKPFPVERVWGYTFIDWSSSSVLTRLILPPPTRLMLATLVEVFLSGTAQDEHKS